MLMAEKRLLDITVGRKKKKLLNHFHRCRDKGKPSNWKDMNGTSKKAH